MDYDKLALAFRRRDEALEAVRRVQAEIDQLVRGSKLPRRRRGKLTECLLKAVSEDPEISTATLTVKVYGSDSPENRKKVRSLRHYTLGSTKKE